MVTGVIQAGSSLGILVPPSVVLVLYGMIARQPVGKLWLAGAPPRPDDGGGSSSLYIAGALLGSSPRSARCCRKRNGRASLAEKLKLNPGGGPPLPHLLLDDRALLHGLHEPRRELGGGRDRGDRSGPPPAPAHLQGPGGDVAQDPRGELHVSLWIIPRRAPASARCSTASGRCARIEGFFLGRLGLGPWEGAHPDAALVPADGHLSRRHGDARHRRAPSTCRSSRCSGSTSSGTGCSTPSPARIAYMTPALRLQPVPDAGHGAAGDSSSWDIYRFDPPPLRPRHG